jgi:hypothetical protein
MQSIIVAMNTHPIENYYSGSATNWVKQTSMIVIIEVENSLRSSF